MIEKILLADDNEMNIKLALYGLRDFDVDVARDGGEALELFSKNNYDMVIMDIRMPIIDGITASRNIRKIEAQKEKKPGTVIVGITAGWIEDIKEECEKAGINGFLPKPYRPKDLPELISEVYFKSINLLSAVS